MRNKFLWVSSIFVVFLLVVIAICAVYREPSDRVGKIDPDTLRSASPSQYKVKTIDPSPSKLVESGSVVQEAESSTVVPILIGKSRKEAGNLLKDIPTRVEQSDIPNSAARLEWTYENKPLAHHEVIVNFNSPDPLRAGQSRARLSQLKKVRHVRCFYISGPTGYPEPSARAKEIVPKAILDSKPQSYFMGRTGLDEPDYHVLVLRFIIGGNIYQVAVQSDQPLVLIDRSFDPVKSKITSKYRLNTLVDWREAKLKWFDQLSAKDFEYKDAILNGVYDKIKIQ